MTSIRQLTEGRLGVHHDVAEANDAAYAASTFVVPSRAGMTLPSERFIAAGCITRAEWERRHAAAYGTRTPSKDQTIDPIETWESHPLAGRPEVPGQQVGGPAAAAVTQPCSTGEARSARDGEGGAPGTAPSHPAPISNRVTAPAEGGEG